jgi:hypothetical protein
MAPRTAEDSDAVGSALRRAAAAAAADDDDVVAWDAQLMEHAPRLLQMITSRMDRRRQVTKCSLGCDRPWTA